MSLIKWEKFAIFEAFCVELAQSNSWRRIFAGQHVRFSWNLRSQALKVAEDLWRPDYQGEVGDFC